MNYESSYIVNSNNVFNKSGIRVAMVICDKMVSHNADELLSEEDREKKKIKDYESVGLIYDEKLLKDNAIKDKFDNIPIYIDHDTRGKPIGRTANPRYGKANGYNGIIVDLIPNKGKENVLRKYNEVSYQGYIKTKPCDSDKLGKISKYVKDKIYEVTDILDIIEVSVLDDNSRFGYGSKILNKNNKNIVYNSYIRRDNMTKQKVIKAINGLNSQKDKAKLNKIMNIIDGKTDDSNLNKRINRLENQWGDFLKAFNEANGKEDDEEEEESSVENEDESYDEEEEDLVEEKDEGVIEDIEEAKGELEELAIGKGLTEEETEEVIESFETMEELLNSKNSIKIAKNAMMKNIRMIANRKAKKDVSSIKTTKNSKSKKGNVINSNIPGGVEMTNEYNKSMEIFNKLNKGGKQ